MNITWATLENIKYFVFYPLFVLIVGYKMFKTTRVIKALGKNPKMFEHYSVVKLIIKTCLYIVGLFLLFLTLLSPQWGKKKDQVKQEGRDIIIALDISKSMLVQDMQPSRLEFAKRKIKDFLSLVDSDRVGLILFSSTSFVQVPLTRDFDSFVNFLDQVDSESISGGSTAIDKALGQALDMFDNTQLNNKKIVILFTDGEDFSMHLTDIKDRAQKENLIILSVGIGSAQGGPIPLYNAKGESIGHQKKKDGSVVISKLNEDMLRMLTQATGGIYIQSTQDNKDLQVMMKRIEDIEKKEFDTQKFSAYEHQYPYFVLGALLCLGVEWIL